MEQQARMLAAALGSVSATYLLCLDDDGFLSDEKGAALPSHTIRPSGPPRITSGRWTGSL